MLSCDDDKCENCTDQSSQPQGMCVGMRSFTCDADQDVVHYEMCDDGSNN